MTWAFSGELGFIQHCLTLPAPFNLNNNLGGRQNRDPYYLVEEINVQHLPTFIYFIIIFLIFGCDGSSLLCVGFLQLQRAGAALHCSARASHCGGFSCCGARALGAWASVDAARGLSSCSTWAPRARGLQQLWRVGSVVVARGLRSCGSQAQQLWHTGLDAPQHVGSSQIRAGTRVPCIGRRILNHCATREAPAYI